MHPRKRIKLKLLINRKDFGIQKKLLPYMLKALFKTPKCGGFKFVLSVISINTLMNGCLQEKARRPLTT